MVKDRVGSLGWLRKQIEGADTDLLREMVRAVTELFMSAEASAVCGAPYGQASADRVNRRNGSVSAAGTRALGRSTWQSPSFAKERTSPTGFSSHGVVRSEP
jgi:transposase-like protein